LIQGANPDVKVECLEILNSVITRFGTLFSVPAIYNPLKEAVFQELSSKRKNNRKKATQCLGREKLAKEILVCFWVVANEFYFLLVEFEFM
jgi:hypothetical protein